MYKFKSAEVLLHDAADKLSRHLELPVPQSEEECKDLMVEHRTHNIALNYLQNINLFYVAITRAKHTVLFEACDGISTARWDRITDENPTGALLKGECVDVTISV